MSSGDLKRLHQAYSQRAQRLEGSDIYSPFNLANLFAIQQRQRDVLALLREQSYANLQDICILELGCGFGGVLLEYLGFGANPTHLHGTDLLIDRLRSAHTTLRHLPLTCSDGQRLPYKEKVFDLVLGYTVFSSILDEGIRRNLASEMLRVLKPSALILWYDFWLNPTNPQTRGIRPAEIKRLFSGCRFKFRRITLAPPIARRLVPVSWLFCELLEKLKIFNTHYLVAIYNK